MVKYIKILWINLWYDYSRKIIMATKRLERLIDQFNKLPGIGRKSAARHAFKI